MKQKKTSEILKENIQGITLIALVITIIVLLILAGVTISYITGENGIISKAIEASEKQKVEAAREEIQIEILRITTNTANGTITLDDLVNENKLKESLSLKDGNAFVSEVKTSDDGENYIDVSYKGYNFKIKSDLSVVYESDSSIDKDVSGEDKEEEIDELAANRILSYKLSNSQNETKDELVVLEDNTGNGHDANLYNISYTENKDGIVFNGTNSYATIDMEENCDYPISVEMMLSATNSKNEILYSNPTKKIMIGIWNNYFNVSVSISSTTYKVPSDFYDGNLKHLVVVFNESVTDFEIYVNGQKLTETVGTDYWSQAIGDDSYIGCRSGREYFEGTMYTLRVYNKVLTQEEILSSYNSDLNFIQKNSSQINRTDLVLEYIVKNNNKYRGSLSKVKDLTGNENDTNTLNRIGYLESRKGMIFNGINSYAVIDMKKDFSYPVSVEIVLSTKSHKNELIYTNPDKYIAIGIYENYFNVSAIYYSTTYKVPSDFYDGNLKHLVVAYNESATDFEIYLNGKKLTDTVGTDRWYQGIGSVSYIGRREYGNYFKGTIYELNLYDKVLSADEIQNNYRKINY